MKATASLAAIGASGLTLSTVGTQEVSAATSDTFSDAYGRRPFADNGSKTITYRHAPMAEYDSDSGKTFQVYQGTDDDPYAVAYDHSAGTFDGPYKVGTNPLPNDDNHGPPALAVDNNSVIHVFYGDHGGAQDDKGMQYARSKNAGDVSSWENFDLKEDDGLPQGTYPSPAYDATNDDIYVLWRPDQHAGSYPSHEWATLARSTDGGDTWEDVNSGIIDQTNGPGDHMDCYVADCDVYNGKVHITWNVAYGDSHNVERRHVFHAYLDPSDDHLYNIQGKDLGTTISWSQVINDCLVFETGGDLDSLSGWGSCRLSRHIYHSRTDTVYIGFYSDKDDDGNNELRLASYDGPYGSGSWNTRVLSSDSAFELGENVPLRVNDNGYPEFRAVDLTDPTGWFVWVITDSGIPVRRRYTPGYFWDFGAVRDGLDDYAYYIGEGGDSDGDYSKTVGAVGTDWDSGAVVDDDSDWNVQEESSLTTDGTWTTETSDGFNGSFIHDDDSGKGDKAATFEIEANLNKDKEREVFVWWPADSQNATNTKIDIYTSDDTSVSPDATKTVDQTANGTQWNSMGTYTFSGSTNSDGDAVTGAKIVIRNDSTDGRVVADAVRLVATTDRSVPTTPSNLTVASKTDTSVTLEWDASSDDDSVAHYNVYVDGVEQATTTNTSYQLTGLQSDTTYTFGVTAEDPTGNTSEPNTVSATTDSGSSLLAHYRLDDDSGTTATDAAGSNDGTLQGDPTWVTDAKLDGALDFDGNGDYVDLGDNFDGTSELTVAGWVNADADNAQTVASKSDYKNDDQSWYVRENANSDGFRFGLNTTDTSGIVKLEAGIGSQQDTWVHVAATYDGETMRVFVDGDEENSKSVSGDVVSSTVPATLGASLIDGSIEGECNGTLDDVRIYNRALSSSEVDDLASMDDGLVGHYTLDNNGSSETAVDSSNEGGANDGTLQGDPQWISGIKKGALDFDGSGDYVDLGDNFDGTSELTVAGWVNADADNAQTVASKSDYKNDDQSWYVRENSDSNGFRFGLNTTDTSGIVKLEAGIGSQQDTWVHVAATYDGETMRIFVDGVEENSKSVSGDVVSSAVVATLGASLIDGSIEGEFDGTLDDVRIYDRALSSNEVELLPEV